MTNGENSDADRDLSCSDGGVRRLLCLLATETFQLLTIMDIKDNWAVKPWYKSGAGWLFVLADLAVLQHIVNNTHNPASTQELLTFSAVIGPAIYIFYRLSENIHLETYNLLSINMKIPMGVGLGVMILVLSRKVTSIPEMFLIVICFGMAFMIDRLFEACARTLDFLAGIFSR